MSRGASHFAPLLLVGGLHGVRHDAAHLVSHWHLLWLFRQEAGDQRGFFAGRLQHEHVPYGDVIDCQLHHGHWAPGKSCGDVWTGAERFSDTNPQTLLQTETEKETENSKYSRKREFLLESPLKEIISENLAVFRCRELNSGWLAFLSYSWYRSPLACTCRYSWNWSWRRATNTWICASTGTVDCSRARCTCCKWCCTRR